MNDTTQTLVRSVVKIGAGYLISRGLINGSEAETLIAAVCGIAAILWGVYHRSSWAAAVPIQQLPGQFDLERIETPGSDHSIANFKSKMANIERRDEAFTTGGGESKRPEGRAPIPSVGPTGRTLLCILFAGALLCGCAWQHTASVHKADGSLAETYTGVVWFNRTALKGLEAHRKGANGSSAALSLKEGNTETQPEALKAGSEGLGIILGTALKYSK